MDHAAADPWEALLARARAEGLAPGTVWRRDALAAFLDALGRSPLRESVVLQGGGALHFCYGSPRLSADLGFVLADPAAGLVAAEGLAQLAPTVAGHRLESRATRPVPRLLRVTLGATIAPGRRLAAKVEVFAIGALRPVWQGSIRVEEPVEIAADKVVACLDRLATRGFVKTFDLFDLGLLLARDPALAVPADLLAAKGAGYGAALDAGAWDALDRHLLQPSTADDLGRDLASVLPGAALAEIDAGATVARVRAALARWRAA